MEFKQVPLSDLQLALVSSGAAAHHRSLNNFLFFRLWRLKPSFLTLNEPSGYGIAVSLSLASLPRFPGSHAKRGAPFSAALSSEADVEALCTDMATLLRKIFSIVTDVFSEIHGAWISFLLLFLKNDSLE